MQFYYGEMNLLRILDEGEFWKRQEEEHTIVIRQMLPNLEENFVRQLREWEQIFAQTEGTIVKYMETIIRADYYVNPLVQQQILQLIAVIMNQSKDFILLLNRIAAESNAVQNNLTALVLINHIRRESEYFIGIAQTVLYNHM